MVVLKSFCSIFDFYFIISLIIFLAGCFSAVPNPIPIAIAIPALNPATNSLNVSMSISVFVNPNFGSASTSAK